MLKTFFLFIPQIIVSVFYSQDSTIFIKTDSSEIKVNYYEYVGKLVIETFNDTDLIRETMFYKDNQTIKSDCFLVKSTYTPIGLYRTFDENGNLKLTIDRNQNTWYPADTSKYPHVELLSHMKLKADSIISSLYSEEFLTEHLKWSITESHYFDKSYSQPSFSIGWLRDDSYKYSPSEFYVVYDLKIDNKIERKAIKLIIDLNGNLIDSHKWNNNWTVYCRGLEANTSGNDLNFKIGLDDALEIAKEHGYKTPRKSKDYVSLEWIKNDTTNSIYNGQWLIYITKLKKTKPKRKKNQSGTFVDYRDTWILDPWTGQFLERKITEREYSIYFYN